MTMYFTCDDCSLSYRSSERAKAHKDMTGHAMTVHVNPTYEAPKTPEFRREVPQTNTYTPRTENTCGSCGGTGVGYESQQVGSGDWRQWITYPATCNYCGGTGKSR